MAPCSDSSAQMHSIFQPFDYELRTLMTRNPDLSAASTLPRQETISLSAVNLISHSSPSLSSTFTPIALPQVTTNIFCAYLFPFARAYPPCLADKGMDQAEFLAYIDGLNEAFMMSPAFRLLSIVGQLVSFSPDLLTTGVAMAVVAIAELAGALTSVLRTRAYIAKHNAETFAQMNLYARIVTTKQLLSLLYADDGTSKTLPLAPLPTCDQEWVPYSAETDPRLRRMTALGDKVATLCWDVEEAEKPEQMLKKMGAWQARRSAARMESRHKRMCERATKSHLTGRKMDKERQRWEKRELSVTQRIRWIVLVPIQGASNA